ncbi:MAG: NADP-dependent malic enzyme [Bacillota bacterium]|nr:NADP-dependent malic enzyme [Bacillota bacterium]
MKKDFYQLAIEQHEAFRGKIEVCSKVSLQDRDDLSTFYTPGVAEPCRQIAADPEKATLYTAKGNLIAVVSDGSAVLGLGNIGAKAAIPVMEGKAILFKKFGNVDAFPICIDSQDVDTIVSTLKLISPVFGGINLEDIASPRCVEIENRLIDELDIPVFHDDQRGTAIVVSAALHNALKLTGRSPETTRVVVNGAGAAGGAIIKLLQLQGYRHIIACGRHGILHESQPLNWLQKELASSTNPEKREGTLADALVGADVFIGVSVKNVVTGDMVRSMNRDAIVFAMANPDPEIRPEAALEGGARIVGTGRSDYPNQINNLLAFPGIFRGTLDAKASKITVEMKLAAVRAIAESVPADRLAPDFIIPDPLDESVYQRVADAVAKAAK